MFNSFVRSLLVGIVVGLIVISVCGKLVDHYRIKPLPSAPKWHLVHKSMPLPTHKRHEHIVVHITQNDADALAYLEKKIEMLDKLSDDRPDLIPDYLYPALNDIIKLQSMHVSDPAYPDAFDQLHSDLEAIADAKERTII